jgi:[methyl-Co(III) methanol-specific corrinoid protein]:coenzyme M methyltransferase
MAMQVVDYNMLLPEVKHSPRSVGRALDLLTDALISVGNSYHHAGADFVTIHEMGGSPGVIGPRAFGELILPRLRRLVLSVRAPTILSVCGNTNKAMELLAEAGARALHVDQTNDLARSRATLGKDVLLFGNLDPVGVIAYGNAGLIRAEVKRAIDAGVDAIMPGCDLYLQTPGENLRAMVEATGEGRR